MSLNAKNQDLMGLFLFWHGLCIIKIVQRSIE